jgi:hypothetical protein
LPSGSTADRTDLRPGRRILPNGRGAELDIRRGVADDGLLAGDEVDLQVVEAGELGVLEEGRAVAVLAGHRDGAVGGLDEGVVVEVAGEDHNVRIGAAVDRVVAEARMEEIVAAHAADVVVEISAPELVRPGGADEILRIGVERAGELGGICGGHVGAGEVVDGPVRLDLGRFGRVAGSRVEEVEPRDPQEHVAADEGAVRIEGSGAARAVLDRGNLARHDVVRVEGILQASSRQDVFRRRAVAVADEHLGAGE